MRAASQGVSEWIDGFLFVANKPILDLLNTKPVLADGPTELLSDVRALERWLIASGTVTSAKAKATLRSWRRSAEDVDATIAGDKGEPAASAVPQLAQNLLVSGFSALQFGQTIRYL